MRLTRKKRGISPVISSVILSAVVVAVGGSIWFFAQGAATVIAEDFIEDILSLRDEATERFTVEHVANNSDCSELYLWIYNYGDVNVTVDSYAYIGNLTYSTNFTTPSTIGKKEIDRIKIEISAQSGNEIAIKVHSRRQNNAFSTYIVP